MKRSYELLIAEAMKLSGIFLDIRDGIKHMNNRENHGIAWSENLAIIIVVFDKETYVIYRLNPETEEITLLYNGLNKP